MDFYAVLDQVIALLRSRGRVTYRALKLQFRLDDEHLEALKEELIDAQQVACEEDGRILVWTGKAEATPIVTSQPDPASQPSTTQQDQPTQTAPPPTEPHPPDAERRQLTVMFCDLVDSTQLSGQLDPEDYRDVLRAYQHTCSDVIHRYDGYIAQHLGDALLVYFGFPVAHEDDAHRAIHAALGMLQAMQRLNVRLQQDKGIRLAIRVGMHTGLTVVGDVGAGEKHEMLALGEAPNVASRIQGIAASDTIAISEATYRLVQGYFTVEELGSYTLKGVTQAQQVYRVMGESGAQSRLDIASTHGLTPLVGREQEIGLLLERWAHVKAGQGQVVLLRGEAGIGKSRLVQVLKDQVADAPHTRLECRSAPYYQNTALYPLTELFQRTWRFHADDTPAEQLGKLEQALRHSRLPLAETVPLFAPLLSLPLPEDRYAPLQWTPQRQRQKTMENLMALLLELAERQPVLLILEDLHWTDPTTLGFLHLLLDQVPTASIYTLLTCRPAWQPTWSHRSYLTEVTLTRLSREQIERMSEHVAGDKSLPAEVLAQIVEKTDGVPLFVEEMTKAMLESGHLQEVEGHYALTSTLPSLAIPTTLHDSLMARLDRLLTGKVIAQLGAVIGRQFSYALLQAIAQLDEAMLQHELGRLVEAELLYQRGVPSQATYSFKHALIQETAYQSLLKSTRQQYHQRIGQVLEAQFPVLVDHQPELLAHHYTEAGLQAQAVEYWQQAGERAIERSANVEAINHLSKGLALLEALPDTPEHLQQAFTLYLALSVPLSLTKGFAAPEAEHVHNQVRAICQQIGDNPQLVPMLWGLWQFYLVRGALQVAQEVGEQLLSVAQGQHDPASLLVAHCALGLTLFYLGEFAPARAHVEQGMALYDPQQHHVLAFRYRYDLGMTCLAYLAQAVWMLGYPDQALQKAHEALTLVQGLSHAFSVANALGQMAVLHQFRREGRAVYAQAEDMLRFSTEQGFSQWLGMGMIMRGWGLAAQGQTAEGITQMRQGLATSQATGAELGRPPVLAQLAEAYWWHTGHTEAGLEALAEAWAVMQNTGERWWEAEMHRLRGELLLQQTVPDAQQAVTGFHQALEVARHQHAKSLELRAATSLARLWQSQGKRQEAYDVLAPVYNWFTEGFDTLDLQEAKRVLEGRRAGDC